MTVAARQPRKTMQASEQYQQVQYGDIAVAFTPDLDGGGTTFGQEFVGVVAERFRAVDHVFEFCAGPGFIGFSLLAHQLCRRLTLADVNPAAVRACRTTIARNGLQETCSAWVSDGLATVPRDERFDLVVSNPPHWPKLPPRPFADPILINFDVDLQLHRRFYASIASYLTPGGSVLVQEHARATSPEDFRDMIADGGLTVVDTFPVSPGSELYFIWSRCD